MTAEINCSTESCQINVRGKCTLFIPIYMPPLCTNVGQGTKLAVRKQRNLKALAYGNLKKNSCKDTHTP